MEEEGGDTRPTMPYGPPTLVVHRLMERFLDTVVRFQCLGREARVSYWRLSQAMVDRLYPESPGVIPVHMIMTGSSYEGMSGDVCGDTDLMQVYRDDPMVVCGHIPEAHTQGYLLAHINPTNPAFLTLEAPVAVEYSNDIVDTFTDPSEGGKEVHTVCRHASSYKFVSRAISEDEERHGPAATAMEDVGRPDLSMVDYVPCLSCNTWPACAVGFLTRLRPSGWPSQMMVDKLRQAGCHVVGVGHPVSDNKYLEWRWSFSVAEKELLHDMNSAVSAAMYVLKSIKNKYWVKDESSQPTTFCSYFIKTACLWVCETTPLPNPTSPIDITRQVIHWLMACYQAGRLPHYFIPEQNLIGHLSKHLLEPVHLWLEKMIKNIWECYLESANLASDIVNVIDVICEQVSVSNTPTNCNFVELLSTISVHENAVAVLEDAITRIQPGSDLHTYQKRYQMCLATSVVYTDLNHGLECHVEENTAISELITLPEKVLLPVIDSVSAYVKQGYADMFKIALYRHMGDIYTELITSLFDDDRAVAEYYSYVNKAVYYYTLGREMVYPDGWSDKGLGGFILLAKLYYLTADWTNLAAALKHLEPMVTEAKGIREVMNCLSYITIEVDNTLCMGLWSADQAIEQELMSSMEDDVLINPVVLTYYFTARLALRHKDIDGATAALCAMEGCVDKLKDSDIVISTTSLMGIVRKFIEEVKVD